MTTEKEAAKEYYERESKRGEIHSEYSFIKGSQWRAGDILEKLRFKLNTTTLGKGETYLYSKFEQYIEAICRGEE